MAYGRKKWREWKEIFLSYFYFGAVSKTTFYYVYVGWWMFLCAVAIASYATAGDTTLNVYESVYIVDDFDYLLMDQKLLEALELEIAVLEQELRNHQVFLEDESSDEFIRRENDRKLNEFLSISLFFSVVILRISLNFFGVK
jgi:hypothetical protein